MQEKGKAMHRSQNADPRGPRRGAALVVVLAIITILLAIGITFFAVSRLEVRTATNVTNTVRVELLADAAVAIAVAALNQDLIDNPHATSLDHPWRSIFSGAWASGKPWMWQEGVPLVNGGAPLLNMDHFSGLRVRFTDTGEIEPLYRGPRSRNWLYIPRAESIPGVGGGPVIILYDEAAELLDEDGQVLSRPRNFGSPAVYAFPGRGAEPPRDYTVLHFDRSELAGGVQGNLAGPNTLPFVTSNFVGTSFAAGVTGWAAQQVHAWADIDNTGDGLRDSMWVPLPEDRYSKDIDFANAPMLAIDHNLSGVPGDAVYPPGAPEPLVFAYYPPAVYPGTPAGRADALGIRLTAPLPGIEVYVDLDGDGQAYDLVPDFESYMAATGVDLATAMTRPDVPLVPLRARLPAAINVPVILPNGALEVVRLGPQDVDNIDNDYNLIVNDYAAYAYVGPNTGTVFPRTFGGFRYRSELEEWTLVRRPGVNSNAATGDPDAGIPAAPDFYAERWRHPGEWFPGDETWFAGPRNRSYTDINAQTTFGNPEALDLANVLELEPRLWFEAMLTETEQRIVLNAIRVTHSGEPVCDLVGRAAIHIRDTAGMVNLNTAGAYRYAPEDTAGGTMLARALNQGIAAGEYETRLLPQIDEARSARLAGLRTGLRAGVTGGEAAAFRPITGVNDFYYDERLPGYGRIDDTGTSLLFAVNNVDNTGDGFIDAGLRVPSPTDPDALLAGQYIARLGLFEGIDDPGELRRFNPIRNRLAETQTREIGASGDRLFFSEDELGLLTAGDGGTPPNIPRRLRGLTTVHSSDRNLSFIQTKDGLRSLRKPDLAHATPQQIAGALILGGGHTSIDRNTTLFAEDQLRAAYELDPDIDPVLEAPAFARADRLYVRGLLRADTGYRAPALAGGGGGVIRTRLGAGDFAFMEHLPADPILQAMQIAVDIADARDGDHTRTLLTLGEAADTTPGGFVTATERLSLAALETELSSALQGETRSLQFRDEWWDVFTGGAGGDRFLRYTVSGNEAIKINELMVRPTRRIEAEALIPPLIPLVNPLELDYDPVFRQRAEITQVLPPVDEFLVFDILDATLNPTPTAYDGVIPGFYVLNSADLALPSVRRAALDLRLRDNLDAFLSQLEASGEVGVILDRRVIRPVYFNEEGLPLPPGTVGVLEDGDTAWVVGVIGEDRRPVLGETTTLLNNESAALDIEVLVDTFEGVSQSLSVEGIPNILQYTFNASEGLPEGRYYLKLNFSDGPGYLDGVADSLPEDSTLRYAIKYVSLFDPAGALPFLNPATGDPIPDIIDDVLQGVGEDLLAEFPGALNSVLNRFQSIEPGSPFLSNEVPGAPGGYAFLNGTLGDPGLAQDFYFTEYRNDVFTGNIDLTAFTRGGGNTHTVYVPPAGSGLALCVAVYLETQDPASVVAPEQLGPFNVNFFEFSQAPAHEYVELVNTSNEVVNLSGWELEIGPPRDLPELLDPSTGVNLSQPRATFRIPEGSFIAPGGMVLLSFGKYDFADVSPTLGLDELGGQILNPLPGQLDPRYRGITSFDVPLLHRNGMGMARGPLDGELLEDAGLNPFEAGALADVSVPPFVSEAAVNPDPDANNLWGPDGDPEGAARPFEPTGSVFNRRLPGLLGPFTPVGDFVNRTGDGLGWRQSAPPAAGETGGAIWTQDDYRDLSDSGLPVPGAGIFDIERLVRSSYSPMFDGTGVDLETAFSGVGDKPWDRIIQLEGSPIDGLTSVQDIAAVVFRGGFLPAYPEYDNWDNDGSGPLLAADFLVQYRPDLDFGDPLHGVDTGRLLLPAFYGAFAEFGPSGAPQPPAYLVDAAEFAGRGWTLVGDFPLFSREESLEMRMFQSRRWYPGDNVIVSLYEGRAEDGRVADRVTYNQLDVEQRTLDEGAFYLGNDENLPGAEWNPAFPSVWPPNHMALDFYRSLERKSPHYNGDRFGLAHRWTPTDGNYDDWAESPSYFVRNVAFNSYPFFQQAVFSRFADDESNRLFRHAMNGSPLQMNLVQRITENPISPPVDPGAAETFVTDSFDRPRQFEDRRVWYGIDLADGTADLGNAQANPNWAYRKAAVPNTPAASLGTLVTTPHATYEHWLVNELDPQSMDGAARWAVRPDSPNNRYLTSGIGAEGRYIYANIGLRSVMLGQDPIQMALDAAAPEVDPPLARLAADTTRTEAMVLTAGQASFTPDNASRAWGGQDAARLSWGAAGGQIASAPAAWQPVFMYQFDGETPSDPLPYDILPAGGYARLFNPAFLAEQDPAFGGNLGLFADYVTARQPLERRAAMYVAQLRTDLNQDFEPGALFEWGPEAGLEGGEYDIYVGTFLPGLVERLRTADTAAAAEFGRRLLDPGELSGDTSLRWINLLPDPINWSADGPTRFQGFCIGDECTDHMLEAAFITSRVERGNLLARREAALAGERQLTVIHPRADGLAYLGRAAISDDEHYLGLYLRLPRNATSTKVNMFTHVVLAPRDRTPGKVNVNTAELVRTQSSTGGDQRLFNAIMGLPGIARDAIVFGAGGIAAPDPGVIAPGEYPPLWSPGFALDGSVGENALQLASLVAAGRTEHPDGRYYLQVSDLATERGGYRVALADRLTAEAPFGSYEDALFPLSNNPVPELRFAEVQRRFSALANHVTTRSDVFEIIATVQAGYGLEPDARGFINFRSDEAFVVTAESRVRTVYERRVPEPGE